MTLLRFCDFESPHAIRQYLANRKTIGGTRPIGLTAEGGLC